MPYAICRSTFIQSLQYKILHRYVNCNLNLYNWKIINSPLCDRCGMIDTIEHFYYECDQYVQFWNNIRIWITQITNININFTVLEVLLGIVQKNDHAILCNYIILHGKKYIYCCKQQEKDVSVIEFLNKLKSEIYTEREISISNNSLIHFEDVFGEIYDSL